MTLRVLATVALLLLAAGASPRLYAEGGGVIAVANDQAITDRDIAQRISLLKVLGDVPAEGFSRKQALEAIIADIVKLAEAKRYKLDATDVEINKRIERLAAGMKTTPDDLNAKLAAQGIATETFRRYIATQIGFNRLLASRYRADIAIKPEDVDRKLAEIKQKVDARDALIRSDPRFKGATVYTLLEITLPVEANDAMAAQLLQARAVEAALVAKRFRGCGNAKAAAAGVFNVRFGKPVEVDAGKMPPQMRKALDRAGPGKAVGPMQGKGGIQLIAFCGSRKVKPEIPKFEMPTREQVENSLINEKYDGFEETYLKNARRSYYVEYRDPTVTQ